MKIAIDKISINGRHRRDLGDIQSLAKSIETIGLLHPVVLTPKNQLVVGERRIAAARLLGWKTIEARIPGSFDETLKLLRAECDENTCRKSFAPTEAFAVGEALWEIEQARARQRQVEAGKKKASAKFAEAAGRTRDKIALIVGMSHLTYEKIRRVVEATRKQPGKYKRFLEEMDRTENVDRAYREVNARQRSQRPPPPIPKGTFDLILADPPWAYDFSPTDNRHLGNQYPTLTVERIAALSLPAAPDAALFLWATAPKLLEALQVMKAWGFEYRTHAVWNKKKIGMGYWFRGQHELLLVGVKGKFPPPNEDCRHSSMIESTRDRHSSKPLEVYAMLERMFPKARRLEMFARSQRKGWKSWGNELP